uniref:Glycosyltransferase n=1 Tax=Anthurium amnicola TaxID=1678845 RepID=A0A1D1Z3V9_9ARAE
MGVGGQHDGQSAGHSAVAVTAQPHVLVVPLPAQGHITSMLKLAELLSLSGMRVTFLNTHYNHRLLLRFSALRDRLARRPCLHLRSIPDGLPDDNPRTADRMGEFVLSLRATWPSVLRELLLADPEGEPPVTCIVGDGFLDFAVDVAEELGIPIIAFRTSSACSVWAYYCIPNLIATGRFPFQDGCDLDELIACVPGMESFLRRRDMPSFCRVKDVADRAMQFVNGATQSTTRFRGLILNTTEFAEASVLTHIRAHLPTTYPIGPVHALLKTVESSSAAEGGGAASSNSASLWQEERTCMDWLDTRPPASVVYVSFGSVALLKRDQLLEFWHGLVNCGYHFLWVARQGLVEDEDGSGVPEKLAEATRERGFLVGWAPQLEVLAHPAVGCFLTHSGWNSTLESMWAGVPMVCWPYFGDQQINSRFVSEVWGIGLDMKDTCDRLFVEKAVREVMAGEGATRMRDAASEMAKMTRESAGEGGSSYVNLERLIRDIRSMSSKTLEKK